MSSIPAALVGVGTPSVRPCATWYHGGKHPWGSQNLHHHEVLHPGLSQPAVEMAVPTQWLRVGFHVTL